MKFGNIDKFDVKSCNLTVENLYPRPNDPIKPEKPWNYVTFKFASILSISTVENECLCQNDPIYTDKEVEF